MATAKNVSKKKQDGRQLAKQIEESIQDYIKENTVQGDNVGIGKSFSEWILYNIFELREDEVIDATEIAGRFDNGIDAVFEYNNEICILQSKFNNSHSIDAMIRFIADCQRVATEPPNTNRNIVQQLCKLVRESYQNKETINCYYITNNMIDDWEQHQLNAAKKNNVEEQFNNLKFYHYDIDNIQEEIEIKKGMLPKDFRNKVIPLNIQNSFENFGTIVAMVRIKDFAEFVIKGTNTLFHSNIRNYLKSNKINQGIKSTLKEEPDKFWYYNNGVTVVCDEYYEQKGSVHITAPSDCQWLSNS